MALTIVAAIDIGSYNLELSIYEINAKKEIRRIDQLRQVVDIGREIYLEGKNSYETIYELCRVLTDYVKVMKEYGAEDCRVCATSALKAVSYTHLTLPTT